MRLKHRGERNPSLVETKSARVPFSLSMRLFSLFLLVAACEASIFTSKDVRVLQGKDFKRLVTASDKLTLAAFIAPWCG